jgi:predicted permease
MAPAHLADAIEASLPEDPENRVRAIRGWDPVTSGIARSFPADFELWEQELSSFAALGAFRTALLQVGDRSGAAAVSGATVTASSFAILRRPPAMGRALAPEDEVSGAPRVAVIGHELWTSRFGADPDLLGRTIRIAGEPHTVVGIMPEGFLFPVDQQVWLPLRDEVPGGEPSSPLGVFGRLAEGATDDEAQAELGAVGIAAIAEADEVRARLRPEVVPFGLLMLGVPRGGVEAVPGFYFFQVAAWALLLIACGNVAMLIFARTITRHRELAVRAALGAGRARIVGQIFAETLVLAVVAAGAGVLVIDGLLDRIDLAVLAGGYSRVPYWLDLGLTPSAALRALSLAVVSATVAGVVPALRITGRGLRDGMQGIGGAGSTIRFGRITGGLVVADVAIAVIVVACASNLADRMTDTLAERELAGIPAEEYLAVEVRLPVTELAEGGGVDPVGLVERLASIQRNVVERLQAEPGVRSVAVAEVLPRMDHPSRLVEVEGDPGREEGTWVRAARVDVDFFDALGAPILQGRGFDRGDLEGDRPVMIVNTVFVERFLGGGDAVGRRVRIVNRGSSQAATWADVVGVIGHLGANMVNRSGGPALYMPSAPGEIHPLQLAVHVAGPPEALAPRVRALLAEVEPDVTVASSVPLGRVRQGDWYLVMAAAAGLAVMVMVLVTLAASGIYAIVSFSVEQRTREIGIRGALGAPRRSLVLAILRRSLLQIGLGAAIGIPLASYLLLDFGSGAGAASARRALILGLGFACAVVAAVGLCSCLVPARRVLRIEASEALRAEG